MSSNSQATNSNSKKLKSRDKEICELCKVPVTKKNRAAHESGKKHKNKEKKKLIQKERKQREKKQTYIEKKVSETPEIPKNNDNKIQNPSFEVDKSDIPFKNSLRPSKEKSVFPPQTESKNSTHSKLFRGHKQQSPDTVQKTSDMPYDSNRNNSQIRHHVEYCYFPNSVPPEYHQYPHGSRGNSNRFPHRRLRSNFRNFEDINGRIPTTWQGPRNPSWQGPRNPSWQGPRNPPWPSPWHGFPPPAQNNGHFRSLRPNVNPHDANPYFLDTEGSYKSHNSNENYLSFETVQYPLESNNGCPDNSLSSTSSKNTEEVETGDSNVNLATTSEETNSQQSKPLKRKNQNVRSIRKASLSTRNSVDSDDAHQDIVIDKLTGKGTTPNENVTGKKIAHWIKPLNPKDEAEVRRLVTEFSKSKKKENLLRLKQQSNGGIERRNSASDEISLTRDNVDSVVESDMSVISSQDASHKILTHETQTVSSNSDKSKSKNSKSVSESSKIAASNERKRKSLSEQSNSKSKKHTSSTNVESVLDSVIRGNYDSSPSLEPHPKSKRNESQLEKNQEETNKQMPPDYTLRCSCIRIGSYKIFPSAICPHLNVILSLDSLSFTAPIKTSENKLITLENKDILKVHIHFGKCMPAMFIRTTSNFGESVRKILHLKPNQEPYFNPTAKDHTINKVTFLIEGITDPQKYYLQHIFPGDEKLININQKTANDILAMSTPKRQISVPEMKEPTIATKKETDLIENSLDQSFTKPFDLNEFLQGQEGNGESSCEAKMTPVESLINYFASGDVQVKDEVIDDPAIDALRGLDPAVLNKVCDGQATINSNVSRPPIPPPSVEKTSNSAAKKPADKPSRTVTGSLKAILKEFEAILVKEKKIKENLQDADQKIQEYQTLLDDWKTKKIKIQNEEELLGHQRNTLVKAMNDLVPDDCTVPNFEENTEDIYSTSSLSPADVMSNDSSLLNSLPSTSNNLPSEVPSNNSSSSNQNSNVEPRIVLTPETIVRPPVENGEKNVEVVEEEIAILPVPRKSVEIPVIDLVDDPVERNVPSSNGVYLSGDSLNDKLSEWKEIGAHKLVVNSIQVFEDFLYTCSSDSTAKRFDLKDLTRTVTYQHEKKNVTQLCIEKINGMTVVFTVCTGSTSISAFQAEVGTLLNTFTFTSNISSICRGRDKIYVGLRDGSIFMCNCKEQKEIVNIGDNIRSIALTYQGCISILITLAVNGSVSFRDAERNGLLIRTLKSNKNLPLFMTVNGDCIYLSGSGVLVVFEIGTGRCLAQYDLSAPYTSLTVYQDYIFTTSYSGFVRCYSQYGEKAVQVYYGAGNTSLTCINVYNGWVFTGNRFGVVDVFKFDPHSSLPCQIGKCDMIFAREKDLELHTLLGRDHDLPSASSKCSWRTCRMKFPRNSDSEAIKCHIREHIKSMHFQDQETLYNFSL